MAFYKSNSCKIGPRSSSSSRFNGSSFLPSLFSQPKGPKPGWMQLLCGAAGLQRNLTASNYVQGPPPHPETLQLSTISSQTMKEFWFFNFSSSFICCLRNSILQGRQKQCLFQYMLGCARVCMGSPLLAQRRLDFTDSDQRSQIFELGAVLRQTDAPHSVSLFT